MKFSENWLRSHVPTQASRDELAATLTAIGLEVEEVTPLGESLQQVVVARIVEAVRHPEADRLQVCQVDAGQGGLLQIVCGAPNARAGLVAPLALVGAQVGGIAIQAAKLRGVESNGMLCSAKELGLDSDASGLFELPDDAPIGQALSEYLGLPDASIEIKLTPNRADCFGVRGIAYDVAAACASEVLPFAAAPVAVASERCLEVRLKAGADAPRYCGRVVEDLDPAAKTPLWMAERLRRCGVRPVSLLVDITQYVMLELGQPMHAFDLDTLHGPVGVRRARAGETLKLLDGRDATLDDGFLAVTDGDRVVALAGLMGGHATRVTDATRHVFLEAAHFAPAAIMGRGRKLGLHTDAGHRFERGVDPALPRPALELATRLVLELAGGRAGPVVEAELPEHLPAPTPIALRRARIVRVLGIEIADAEVERILRALGMEVAVAANGWQVTAPSRRFDIALEEDLIEELARIHGYDRLPTTLPGGASRIAMGSETQLDELSVRRQLVAREMLETINYAFVDAALLDQWGLDAGRVALANPLSAELAVMRPSLLPGLVAALGRNVARQAGRVRLFELGKVFEAAVAAAAPIETQRVAAAVCGDADALQWGLPARKVDFHDLKGDLDALASATGARLDYHPSALPFAHPTRSADVYRDGARIGWIGQLHPRLLQALQIDVEVLGFELDLAPLAARALPRAAELSRFPSVRRDLAFLVPEAVAWSALVGSVRGAVGPLLREVVLFDRYVGPGVEAGFKSLAMGLILQDNSRTLTDCDVEAVVADAVAVLAREHDARIRG
ncbi:phenylalanine--tRNA ligase subunit beta [Xanthomonas translucens]|uniref:phenylalanine--tRNA ligase subunit beta n=1 Tax=Xanthomonas campestris pv. translucens TaxID=343 RepID=UPI000641A22B|nr:phenylalanine--tRNA ligase subunit beta [Xanthomonas translucens]AKK67417.1 phenylalanyl-tRNA synthetase [Xanthomonas translucens pv. undulosa]MCT8270917.1 phenylalanine--tRNA ligase subunit beta [Xanthomonas translucens pv. undulosa]QEO26172.1 phenylalanine--tRNA ligase subunit beta [Xanthomonas translucens pv. undulosa]QSQ53769.1 phenylalanine--tRNA ligase subunit beta [Xanthomonas translucens pv. undulosa]QSQ60610.1 phenylalanine--tRNA ligase subunit beta [Xanthomonas translucens pv. und